MKSNIKLVVYVIFAYQSLFVSHVVSVTLRQRENVPQARSGVF